MATATVYFTETTHPLTLKCSDCHRMKYRGSMEDLVLKGQKHAIAFPGHVVRITSGDTIEITAEQTR